jgi:hypothetical protein
MSLIKANAVQVGQSPTATQNFTLAVPSSPDGTIKLARGNAGATTQDVLSVDANGNINGLVKATGSTTARSLANRFADVVNVKDFGAVGDGVANDTAAIQSAINTGKSIVFPEGTYLANNLTQSTNEQRFYALGNVVIQKNANGVLFTSSGRSVMCEGIKFYGNVSFTGDCVKTTGDNCVFTNCSIWTKFGFGLLAEGGGTRIIGTSDIYYSDDATGYAICLGNTSNATNYHQIIGITTSTSSGGILLRRSNGSVTSSQIGKFDMNTGAMYVSNCRITGDLIIKSSFSIIENCTIAGDVTIGDGVNAISGIGIGSNVFCQSGSTITLNANVRESSINLTQNSSSGITIIDNLTGTANDIDNNIFLENKTYTPAWTGSSSNPSIGNGSITGNYSRLGRFVFATIELVIGSTTTLGSGFWFFGLPTTSSGLSHQGSAVSTDLPGGTAYVGAATTNYANNYCLITTSAGNVTPTTPFTWGAGDIIRLTIQYPSI